MFPGNVLRVAYSVKKKMGIGHHNQSQSVLHCWGRRGSRNGPPQWKAIVSTFRATAGGVEVESGPAQSLQYALRRLDKLLQSPTWRATAAGHIVRANAAAALKRVEFQDLG